jgi:hypothetical protein
MKAIVGNVTAASLNPIFLTISRTLPVVPFFYGQIGAFLVFNGCGQSSLPGREFGSEISPRKQLKSQELE